MTTTSTPRGDWQAVDLMTTEVIGYYNSDIEAHDANRGRAIEVFYKPLRRKVRK